MADIYGFLLLLTAMGVTGVILAGCAYIVIHIAANIRDLFY